MIALVLDSGFVELNMNITVPQGFEPRPYQLALFQAMDGISGKPGTKKKKAIQVWPRQIGKDTGDFAYMVKEAAVKPGNYFYIFPTKEMARRALWEKIMDDGVRLLELMPSELVKRLSNQEMLMELTNGSTIRALGVDKDSESIRGITPTGVVYSEFAYSDITTYRALLPAIDKNNAWIIINSTPNGRNHFYNLHLYAKNSDEWHYTFLQCLWPDRPNYIHVFDQKYFLSLVDSGSMTWEDIEREYGCSFSTGMKGSFYADYLEKAQEEGRIGEFIFDPTLKVDTFWDLGYDDDTAIWFRQRLGNHLVFIDYYEERVKDLSHYVAMLESKGYKFGTHFLPHDARQKNVQTGQDTATLLELLLERAGVTGSVEVLDRSGKQDGINSVRARFPRYCFDYDNCRKGLKHLEMYHRKYDKRREIFITEPVHDEHSHSADALRVEAMSEDLNHDPFFSINKLSIIQEDDPWKT